MGWDISDIVLPADIEQFQKEVFVIRISIPLSTQGLDFVVDPFDLARSDLICCMSDDSFKVIFDHFGEPCKVTVLC